MKLIVLLIGFVVSFSACADTGMVDVNTLFGGKSIPLQSGMITYDQIKSGSKIPLSPGMVNPDSIKAMRPIAGLTPDAISQPKIISGSPFGLKDAKQIQGVQNPLALIKRGDHDSEMRQLMEILQKNQNPELLKLIPKAYPK